MDEHSETQESPSLPDYISELPLFSFQQFRNYQNKFVKRIPIYEGTTLCNFEITEKLRKIIQIKEKLITELINQKTEQFNQFKRRHTEISKQCSDLIKSTNTLTCKTQNLEKEKAQLQDMIALLKQENSELTSNIVELKTELKNLTEQKDAAHLQSQEMKAQGEIETKIFSALNSRNLSMFSCSLPPPTLEIFQSLIEKIEYLEKMNQQLIEENKSLKKEIEKYKTTITDLTSQVETMNIKIQKLNEKKSALQMNLHSKVMYIAKIKKSLQKQKAKVQIILRNKHLFDNPVINEITKLEKDDVIPPPQFNHEILADLVKNDILDIRARHFTARTIELCYILYVYSPASYNFLRKLLPLPSRQTIYEHMGETIERKSQNLLNIEQLEFMLKQIKDSYSSEMPENSQIAALASDAASADPQRTNTGAVFCYNLQPLSKDYQTSIVHISQNKTGRASETEIAKSRTITDKAEKVSIKIIYNCTDGDPKTNTLHKKFQDYLSGCSSSDFFSIVQFANGYKDLIPVSDWLHILKNLRSRLLKHLIHLSENHDLNFAQICKDLKENVIIYKKTAALSMRDDLALHIFNTFNLQMIFEKQIYDEFLFILPFVLTTVVIQSTTLSIEARLDLLDLSYQLIDNISQHSTAFPQSPTKRSKEKKARYLTNTQFMRIKNTIIAFGHALTFHSNGICLSRLGTHLVEFIFARMRRMSYSNNNSDVLAKSIVKGEVVKTLLAKYGFEEEYRGRVDFGGSRHDPEKWTTNLPINKQTIVQEVQQLLQMKSIDVKDTLIAYSSHYTNLHKLVIFLSTHSPSPKIILSGIMSGAMQYARNIAFSKEQNDHI